VCGGVQFWGGEGGGGDPAEVKALLQAKPLSKQSYQCLQTRVKNLENGRPWAKLPLVPKTEKKRM